MHNISGFSAVPAGHGWGSNFFNVGSHAYLWSSTQDGSKNAYGRLLYYDNAGVHRGSGGKNYTHSVRCLRDSLAVEIGDDTPIDTISTPSDTTTNPTDTTQSLNGMPCPAAPTVTDHEGNVYATVQIGQQCWMRDNLRTTTSPSTGTYLIPDTNATYTYTGKQARWYRNDSATYALMNYGLLYNWNAAVDTFNTAYGETSVITSSYYAVSVTFNSRRRGVCPVGWHLPSQGEWMDLFQYVGNQSNYLCGNNSNYIAKALASTTGWSSSTNNCAVGNTPGSNNATGFSAVPAGFHSVSSFYSSGDITYFWSSTRYSSSNAYGYYLGRSYADVDGGVYGKGVVYSVRCLRD